MPSRSANASGNVGRKSTSAVGRVSDPAFAPDAGEGSAAADEDQLKLLDGFELRCGGRIVPLPAGSQRMVAFLALRARPVRRACVAESLWFTRSPDHGLSCLRSALWRTRRSGVVDATRDRLALAPNVAVDVHELICYARRLLDPCSPVPAGDRDLLERELLPDWYDEWVEFERLRLRQLRLHAIEALAERFISSARFGDAIEVALVAISNDPLRESAYRLLIKAHVGEGNVAEAIRQYRRYSDLLRSRFNLAPTEAVNQLVRPLGALT